MGAACSEQRQKPTTKPDLSAFMDEGDATYWYDPEDGFRYPDEKRVKSSQNKANDLGREPEEQQNEDSRNNMDPLDANSYETDQDDDSDDDDGDATDDDTDFDSTNEPPRDKVVNDDNDDTISPLNLLSFGKEKKENNEAPPELPKTRDRHIDINALSHIISPLVDKLPIGNRDYAEGKTRFETPVSRLVRHLFLNNTSGRIHITAKHWARQNEQDCILLPAKVRKAGEDVAEELALTALVDDAERSIQGNDGEDMQMVAAAFRERENEFKEQQQRRMESMAVVLPNARNEDDDMPFDWQGERQKYENILAGFRNSSGSAMFDPSNYYTIKTGFVRKGVSKDVAMEIARARRQDVLDRESDRRVLMQLDVEEMRRMAEREDETNIMMDRMDTLLR